MISLHISYILYSYENYLSSTTIETIYTLYRWYESSNTSPLLTSFIFFSACHKWKLYIKTGNLHSKHVSENILSSIILLSSFLLAAIRYSKPQPTPSLKDVSLSCNCPAADHQQNHLVNYKNWGWRKREAVEVWRERKEQVDERVKV